MSTNMEPAFKKMKISCDAPNKPRVANSSPVVQHTLVSKRREDSSNESNSKKRVKSQIDEIITALLSKEMLPEAPLHPPTSNEFQSMFKYYFTTDLSKNMFPPLPNIFGLGKSSESPLNPKDNKTE